MMAETDNLPRILCLHGVGSNADILLLQTRALREKLSSSFRFVFANGPFFSEAGPGVLPAYAGADPYRRWLRWIESHRVLKPKFQVEAIRRCLEDAMAQDDESGGCGPWIGLLGFSQGARLSASILFECQRRQEAKENGVPITGYEGSSKSTLWSQDWQFAALFAAPAPLVALSPETGNLPLQSPTELGASLEDLEKALKDMEKVNPYGELSIERPTLHVIGVEDEWAPSQRKLYDTYCSADARFLLEWEGDHRIPIQTSENDQICARILEMAGKQG
ncbi:unnamed protein product [Penicillium salamii]|uniref:Serine hydrolase domain-containing protein n=1 Tax=Penicillium salamii TaxID=1612424 RepID=A0A9W4J0T4_9EURO|nr:unnamed protein product [Penicillium salamii]CAG8009841.1 unnamed protein product [Penicillium salamii]CAG8022356.1 unnamed protein product [Penicillium salamii]CAG8119399.1 unnamed protein product [Penicillium salamii]CAG8145329.1 unnamed protein product [Penicillium salamii]